MRQQHLLAFGPGICIRQIGAPSYRLPRSLQGAPFALTRDGPDRWGLGYAAGWAVGSKEREYCVAAQ